MRIKNFVRAIEITRALKGKKDSGGRCYHTTFIFHKNRVVAIGINNYNKTHPKTLKHPYRNKCGDRYLAGVHSELNAILKLKHRDYNELEVLNLRLDKNNKISLSKPCHGCQHLLKQLNFKAIYYSNKIGKIEKM